MLLEIVEINHWRIGGNKLAINKPLLKWPLRLPRSNFNLILKTFFYQMPDLHQISLGGRALISDYLILGMSAKILSSVNLPKTFDHLVWIQDSFVDKIDPCKIAPHALQ